jgi:hypothetical protein
MELKEINGPLTIEVEKLFRSKSRECDFPFTNSDGGVILKFPKNFVIEGEVASKVPNLKEFPNAEVLNIVPSWTLSGIENPDGLVKVVCPKGTSELFFAPKEKPKLRFVFSELSAVSFPADQPAPHECFLTLSYEHNGRLVRQEYVFKEKGAKSGTKKYEHPLINPGTDASGPLEKPEPEAQRSIVIPFLSCFSSIFFVFVFLKGPSQLIMIHDVKPPLRTDDPSFAAPALFRFYLENFKAESQGDTIVLCIGGSGFTRFIPQIYASGRFIGYPTVISDNQLEIPFRVLEEGKVHLRAACPEWPWTASNFLTISIRKIEDGFFSAHPDSTEWPLGVQAMDGLRQALEKNNAVLDRQLRNVRREHFSCLDSFSQSPLHVAVRFQMAPEARKLLKAGVPISIQDSFGETPLHWAVKLKAKNLVKLLVKEGADENKQNFAGESPLSWATKNNLQPIVEILNKKQPKLKRKVKEILKNLGFKEEAYRECEFAKRLEDVLHTMKGFIACDPSIHSEVSSIFVQFDEKNKLERNRYFVTDVAQMIAVLSFLFPMAKLEQDWPVFLCILLKLKQ